MLDTKSLRGSPRRPPITRVRIMYEFSKILVFSKNKNKAKNNKNPLFSRLFEFLKRKSKKGKTLLTVPAVSTNTLKTPLFSKVFDFRVRNLYEFDTEAKQKRRLFEAFFFVFSNIRDYQVFLLLVLLLLDIGVNKCSTLSLFYCARAVVRSPECLFLRLLKPRRGNV